MRASERFDQIQRFLSSRENVLGLIESYDLFPEVASESIRLGLTRGSMSINRLIDPALLGRPDAQPFGLSVSVRLDDPFRAADLVNSILNSAVEEDYRLARIRLAADLEQRNRTLGHLMAEEARVSAETDTVNTELAEFRAVHADSLPENLPELRARLEEFRGQQATIDADLVRLETTPGQTSMETNERYRAHLDDQRAAVDEEVAQIEAALAAAPEVDSALAVFSRRLATLEAELQAIVMQRTQASMSQSISSGDEFARLFVLEAALTPEFPVSRSARKLALAGGVAVLGVALGLAFLRELQRPAIRTASQMQRQLGIVPVVVIPYVAAPVAIIYRRMGLAGGLAGAVALLMWYTSARDDWLAPGAMSKLMQTELSSWLASDAAQ
jgi:hypothetical protein